MRGNASEGRCPEPGFYSLSGLEQVQAFRRGVVARTLLAHLLGLAVPQVGPQVDSTCPYSAIDD